MTNYTAAIIIIGDEILSGRTTDTNTQYIANALSEIGINLIEVRIIGDDRSTIIKTVLKLSARYNYVFTTGGIGPTHDDITSEAISTAFGLKYVCNDKAKTIIKSKTKSDSISGRLEVGYDYKVNQKVHVVPTTGFSFIDVKIDKYKEEGSGLTRSIAKRKVGKNSFLVGVSTFYVSELNNNTKIIPELHVNLDQAISTKNSDTVLTISEDIAPITVTAEKLPKTYYNIGTSVKSVFKDNIEVSLGYDLDMAKKFTSHTGNLKLKINF